MMWKKVVAVILIVGLFCQPVFASGASSMTLDEINQMIENTKKEIDKLNKANEEKSEERPVVITKLEDMPAVVVTEEEPKQAQEVGRQETVSEVSPEILPVVVDPVVDTEPRYDFEFQNVNIKDAILAIAKRAGKDISIDAGLKGLVSNSFHNKTFEHVLEILANTLGFNWMMQGDTLLVAPANSMLQNKRFVLKHANMKFVKDEIIGLGVMDNAISVNTEYNAVSVTGTPYMLSMVEKRLDEIDKPVEQCLIVAKMVELSKSDSLDLGLQYTMPSLSGTIGTSGSSDSGSSGSGSSNSGVTREWNMTYSISSAMNKSIGKGKIISRPLTLVRNGQEALVIMGDQVPVLTSTATTSSTQVTVEYKDVGSKLKVRPVMNKEDKIITLYVDTQTSGISKWINYGSISAPQISNRQATTVAHLKAGETLIIGGLMNRSEMDNLSGIPGLMNLPILGKLFQFHRKSRDNTEVVIMVTPYFVDNPTMVRKIAREE